MARNYAALLHEYLEEMEDLSDAEFGRLCRSLLEYSMTGTCPALSGNERFYFKRVKMQEDRFQASYDELSEKRREAGRKGAEIKHGKANQSQATPSNAKLCQAEPSKTSYTKTETNTNTNIKTTSSPPYPPSWGEGLRSVMDSWLAYKAEKKQGYKPQGLKSLITQVDGYASKYGEQTVIAVIQRSMAANYQGVVWDWLQKSSGQAGWKPGKGQGTDQKSAQEAQADDLLWLQDYMKNREGGDSTE